MQSKISKYYVKNWLSGEVLLLTFILVEFMYGQFIYSLILLTKCTESLPLYFERSESFLRGLEVQDQLPFIFIPKNNITYMAIFCLYSR